MIHAFYNNFTKLINEHQKKMEIENPFPYIQDVELFLIALNKLTILNLKTNNKDLHLNLIGFADTAVDIAMKRKLKPKHLEVFLSDVAELKGYLYLINESNDADDYQEIIDEMSENELIWRQNEFTVDQSIDHYCNLLLSKTVDYIPENHQGSNQWNLLLDTFKAFKEKLQRVKALNPILVYNFTEIIDYTPFSLRYLDTLNKLGEKMENWIDYARQNKLVNMAERRGYHIFAGWGNLSESLNLVGNTLEEEKPVPHRDPMTEAELQKVSKACLLQVPMFAMNPLFRMNVVENKAMFLRVMAVQCYNDKEISVEQIDRIVTECRAMMKKHYRKIYYRDQKLWFTDIDAVNIHRIVTEFYQHRWAQYAALLIKQMFDTATPDANTTPSEMDEMMKRTHHFLAVTYNVLYHSKGKLPNEDIQAIMKHSYEYLIPRFSTWIPKENQWMLEAGLEFALDINRQERLNQILYVLRTWFSTRHSREDNEQFFNTNKYSILFASYSVKKAILESLEEKPIEFISYNGSREFYNDLIAIIRRDIDNPIMQEREVKLEFNEDGIDFTRAQ